MTERLDIVADSLAQVALKEAADPVTAAAILFQAGGSLLVTTFSPEMAVAMLEQTVVRIRAKIEDTFGVGQARQ